jgi:hypothetical protein
MRHNGFIVIGNNSLGLQTVVVNHLLMGNKIVVEMNGFRNLKIHSYQHPVFWQTKVPVFDDFLSHASPENTLANLLYSMQSTALKRPTHL